MWRTNTKKAASLYIFLTTPDDVENHAEMMQSNSPDNSSIHHYDIEILNFFDPELQLINTKPIMKTS